MNATSAKSKVLAAVLALIVGEFGVHNFYLGHITPAVVQLVLSLTCFGMAITVPWALIECILILVGTIRDSDGRELS